MWVKARWEISSKPFYGAVQDVLLHFQCRFIIVLPRMLLMLRSRTRQKTDRASQRDAVPPLPASFSTDGNHLARSLRLFSRSMYFRLASRGVSPGLPPPESASGMNGREMDSSGSAGCCSCRPCSQKRFPGYGPDGNSGCGAVLFLPLSRRPSVR